MRQQLVRGLPPVSAEGVQCRVESVLLIPSEPGVEVLGFLVVILYFYSASLQGGGSPICLFFFFEGNTIYNLQA